VDRAKATGESDTLQFAKKEVGLTMISPVNMEESPHGVRRDELEQQINPGTLQGQYVPGF
jgi:hypothetical protein